MKTRSSGPFSVLIVSSPGPIRISIFFPCGLRSKNDLAIFSASGSMFARHDLPVVGERLGHAERRVPREHSELEDALRVRHSHHHAEERAFDPTDLHLRVLHLLVRDHAQLVEERRDGIGMGRGVMFDGLGDECQHGRAAYDATDPRSSVTRPR